jgi:hypothetical protein
MPVKECTLLFSPAFLILTTWRFAISLSCVAFERQEGEGSGDCRTDYSCVAAEMGLGVVGVAYTSNDAYID